MRGGSVRPERTAFVEDIVEYFLRSPSISVKDCCTVPFKKEESRVGTVRYESTQLVTVGRVKVDSFEVEAATEASSRSRFAHISIYLSAPGPEPESSPPRPKQF
ncbi:unnamed protein product [Tenebrio molitor]|jgi:hypothetical protein|nr:unnamed protein product [Tenebrio molitor]